MFAVILSIVLVLLYAAYVNWNTTNNEIRYDYNAVIKPHTAKQSIKNESKKKAKSKAKSADMLASCAYSSLDTIQLGVIFPGDTLPSEANVKFVGKVWSTHFKDPKRHSFNVTNFFETMLGMVSRPLSAFHTTTPIKKKLRRNKSIAKSENAENTDPPEITKSPQTNIQEVNTLTTDIVLPEKSWNDYYNEMSFTPWSKTLDTSNNNYKKDTSENRMPQSKHNSDEVNKPTLPDTILDGTHSI